MTDGTGRFRRLEENRPCRRGPVLSNFTDTTALGVQLMQGDLSKLGSFVAGVGYDSLDTLRHSGFAVVPLLMLMRALLSHGSTAGDFYGLADRLSQRLPGRFAVATVIANALFGFVCGIGAAPAVAASRIAYPAMRRAGYRRDVALGAIAGSAGLAALLPPSMLMIVWCLLTGLPIGKLFLAGIVPVLLAAVGMAGYAAYAARQEPASPPGARPVAPATMAHSVWPPLALVAVTLVLISGGFCTPTQGAAIGFAGALGLAIVKGLSGRDMGHIVLDVVRAAGPLLLLLFCALLYTRILSIAGFTDVTPVSSRGAATFAVLALMIAIWLVLGSLIDSIGVILLTAPIFAPWAARHGIDPQALAIMAIIAIQIGLLIPPFGLLAYTVKAAVQDRGVELRDVFRGTLPYCVVLLAIIAALALFPPLATFLPSL